MIIKYFRSILSGLYSSLKRFPMTILFSASVAFVLIIISETNPSKDNLSRIAMILALGIPVSLCIKLIFERKEEKNPYKLAAGYLCGILFLILYYFIFLKDLEMVSTTRFIAVNLALYLCFLFIPYFLKREQFEMYVITVFTGFFITIIYSIVLYGGLSAILFAIDKLLGIRILGKIYYYTWLFVVFIFALAYFLSGIPIKDKELTAKSYPKLLRILLLYIVMPLLTAYTIILYIYFGKIIITKQWPIGLVSHLVLWYSVIVTIVLFFITPIKDESPWQNKFLKFSPKILIPLLIMMFISIGIRINAYGVTEKRYFVVILGLWIFLMMIYFSFIKKYRNIIIPVTLSIVAMISVFGPFSSYSISKLSQNNRFEKLLIKNDMLKNEKIQNSSNISQEDKASVSSILEYFNKNHSLKNVKYLPQNFKLDDMNKVFGFSFVTPNYGAPEGYFTFIVNQPENAVDIRGYDYLFDARAINSGINTLNSPLTASYSYETSVIKVKYKGVEIFNKNLNSFVKNLIEKHGTSPKNPLSSNEMTLVEENEKVKIKLIFFNISGNTNPSTQTAESKEVEFYMLVKVK